MTRIHSLTIRPAMCFHLIFGISPRILYKRGVLSCCKASNTVYSESITIIKAPNCFLNSVKNLWHCGTLTTWWIVALGYYDNAWLSGVICSKNVRPSAVDGWYQLITPWTKWPLFRGRYFQMHFREWKCMNFDYDFTEFYSQGFIEQYPSIGLDNGWAPNRRQAIIGTNADPIHWHIYAAVGGEGLTLVVLNLF